MSEISDSELIAIAVRYGELLGTSALADAMGYTERHASRMIRKPPERINDKNRKLGVAALPEMVEAIERAEAQREAARQALRRSAVRAADDSSSRARGSGGSEETDKQPERDAG